MVVQSAKARGWRVIPRLVICLSSVLILVAWPVSYPASAAPPKPARPASPNTIGPVLWLHLDEPAGATSFLDSATGNSYTCTLCPAAGVPGRLGSALSFSSGRETIDLNRASLPAPWTASFWINRGNTDAPSVIILSDAAHTVALKLEQYNQTHQVGVTQYGVADYTFGYTAPQGVWVHLVFVGTGSQTQLYVNGILQGVLNTPLPLPLDFLGLRTDPGGTFSTAGLLDEVLVYDRALSAADITALYDGYQATQWTATPPGTGAALAPPGLYFDAGNSQVFVAGNSGYKSAYDGSNNGAPLWNQNVHGAVQDRGPIIPVAGTNVTYFTSQDGWVNALDVNANGNSFWGAGQGQIAGNGNLLAGVAYQPNVNVGGTFYNLIFAGTYTNSTPLSNRLVALNAETGDPIWEFTNAPTGLGIIPTRPAVNLSANTVYFGTANVSGNGGGVWAVHTTDGSLRWSRTDLGEVRFSVPALSDDGATLYIGTVSGTTYTLYALRTSDGSTRAQFTAPAGVGGWHGTAWSDGVGATARLYASAGDRLYAFLDDGSTGTLPFLSGWNTPPTYPYNGGPGYATIPGAGSPLLLSDASHASVYISGADNGFYKLNMDTGSLTRQLYLGGDALAGDPGYDYLRDAFYLTTNGALYSIAGNW